MTILSWMLFGLVVGVVANAIDPYPSRGGLLGSIVLGIVGALLGGFVSDLLFGVGITGFNFTSLVISIAGALLLLFIDRALTRV